MLITGLDVLLLLGFKRMGMRSLEAIVLVLVATIGVCYFIEVIVLPQTRPSLLELGGAIVSPTLRQTGMTFVAIGIIGATVMPHNLYLHSALVQSRRLKRMSVRSTMRFDSIRSIRSSRFRSHSW